MNTVNAHTLSFKIKDEFPCPTPPTYANPVHLGGNFKSTFWEKAKEETIFLSKTIPKLQQYVLPAGHMKDSTIAENTSSSAMDENTLWVLLFSLIGQPRIGEDLLGYTLDKNLKYLLQVKNKYGEVSCCSIEYFYDRWDQGLEDGWHLNATDTESNNRYSSHKENNVFLYFRVV